MVEGRVDREGAACQRITFHLAFVDLKRVAVTPLVNQAGLGYKWGDATVRGYISGSPEYFAEVNSVFRRLTLHDYFASFTAGGDKLMATDANGNLFWNLGHWIFTGGKLYRHFREVLRGGQTALIMPHDSVPLIGAVDFGRRDVFAGIRHAVFGQRLISGGQIVNILSTDKETGRPIVSEFAGDLNPLVAVPRIPSLSRQLFASSFDLLPEEVDPTGMSELARKVFEQDRPNLIAKSGTLHPLIKSVVAGKEVAFTVEESEQMIRAALKSAGYGSDYSYESGTKTLRFAFRRAGFGYSLIGLDAGRETLFIGKTYTDFSRKGLTLEETALLLRAVCGSFGAEVADALVMSGGGDLRIGLAEARAKLKLISTSEEGEPLLYRGGKNYGITSAFTFSLRK
jgi:hypothetical protein